MQSRAVVRMLCRAPALSPHEVQAVVAPAKGMVHVVMERRGQPAPPPAERQWANGALRLRRSLRGANRAPCAEHDRMLPCRIDELLMRFSIDD
jgi:hypothetical protein